MIKVTVKQTQAEHTTHKKRNFTHTISTTQIFEIPSTHDEYLELRIPHAERRGGGKKKKKMHTQEITKDNESQREDRDN